MGGDLIFHLKFSCLVPRDVLLLGRWWAVGLAACGRAALLCGVTLLSPHILPFDKCSEDVDPSLRLHACSYNSLEPMALLIASSAPLTNSALLSSSTESFFDDLDLNLLIEIFSWLKITDIGRVGLCSTRLQKTLFVDVSSTICVSTTSLWARLFRDSFAALHKWFSPAFRK